MGEIVWAAGAVHAPQLITRPPQEDQAQLEADIVAMAELGRELDESKPDVLIVLGIDHVETFFPGSVPAFAIVTGETATAEFAGHNYELPIHQGMARALLDGLVGDGIDLAYTHEALLGHAFVTPFEYIHAGRAIPVVPMFVNVYLPPLPTTHRCIEVGQVMAKVIASRPERVAILASGGLSHYPGTWKYYYPEYDFDRWAIQELEEGRAESLLDLTGEQLDEVGNTEILPWIMMLGATGSPRGELLTYQPTSHHGHAVMRFIPDRGGRGQEHREIPLYGGFAFKGQGYEFYKYPTIETYPLNKALFRLRTDADLRSRFVRDMDGVMPDLGISGAAAEALKTINADAVVAEGAHGILAVTAMLAVQLSARDAGIDVKAIN
jgi:2,3-dihydroxyphenylpropionate 1,2-dioxygenase